VPELLALMAFVRRADKGAKVAALRSRMEMAG
jgi:hypothetical protein